METIVHLRWIKPLYGKLRHLVPVDPELDPGTGLCQQRLIVTTEPPPDRACSLCTAFLNRWSRVITFEIENRPTGLISSKDL